MELILLGGLTSTAQLITFDDQGYTNGQTFGTTYGITNNGETFSFSLPGGGSTNFSYRTTDGLGCSNTGHSHLTPGGFTVTPSWAFETMSGNEFNLGTIKFDNVYACFSFAYNLSIEGFKNGLSTGVQLFTTPGMNAVFSSNANFNDVDRIVITSTTGDLANLGIDNINWVTNVVPCTEPDIPTITATPNNICPGSSSTLSWTGSLNDATAWHVYTTSCGVTQLTTTTGNSLVVSPGATTTYYIRGEDGAGCVDESTGLCGTATVTVQDITNPTVSCPGNQVGSVDGSCNYTLPDYTPLAIAADNCLGVTVTQSPVAGTIVGVGTTNIVFTAIDGASNTANCNFDVVVSDNTNPTISCSGNQNVSLNASCNYILLDYTGLATVADNCNPSPTVTQSPAAGTVITSIITIMLTVDDGNGNTANCTFNVSPFDNTNPIVTCPGNQTESPNASCQFTLPDYTGLVTVADNCGAVTVTQSPVSGTVISGTTTVTMTGTDGSSNTTQCTFDVVLNDATVPTAVCQSVNAYLDAAGNVTIVATDIDGGSTDNCSGLTFSVSTSYSRLIIW